MVNKGLSDKGSVDQTQAERPYVFFLFKGITRIYEVWSEDNIEAALRDALRLVVFLPTDVKEALKDEKKKIQGELIKAYNVRGLDWFTQQQNRNRAARQVSAYYLEGFMDKMVRLLDEKKWLEKGALRPRFRDKRKLKV